MSIATDFFTDSQKKSIISAIKAAEKMTSGEIRLHVEDKCRGDIFKRTRKIFHRLKMDRTELRNGILFYLAVKNHRFAIWGDQGIHSKIDTGFWDNIRDEMEEDFKAGEFAAGIEKGIRYAGEQLKLHFPYQKDDINELPDEISFN